MTAITQDIRIIPLSELREDPRNLRRDLGDVAELAASLREFGLVQPIVVRPQDGHFAVVAGRRRWAAAKAIGLTEIAAVVRPYTDAAASEASLIENLQRKDLNPLEEAAAYKAWLLLTKRTQEDLAKAIGKARPTIANTLRLLEAPPPIRQAVEDGRLTAAHARVAMSVPERSLDLLDLKRGVSVEGLTEQAKRANRLDAPIAALRDRVAKAKQQGKTVTWPTSGYRREAELAGQSVDLVAVLGTPSAKLAGELRDYDVTRAVHDQVCKCDTLAVGGQGGLVPACSSPTGWKKAQARLRKNMGQASPKKKAKVQSAAAKASRLKRVEKQSAASAAKAYAGTNLRSWSGLTTTVAPKFFKGGITGEPARLVLFGLVAKYADARGPMWKLELWKKIAAVPLADVRLRVEKYLLGLAFREIADASRYGDKYGNTRKIRALVDAHYAPRRAKKAAKR